MKRALWQDNRDIGQEKMWPLEYNSENKEGNAEEEEEDEEEENVQNEEMALPWWMTYLTRSLHVRRNRRLCKMPLIQKKTPHKMLFIAMLKIIYIQPM